MVMDSHLCSLCQEKQEASQNPANVSLARKGAEPPLAVVEARWGVLQGWMAWPPGTELHSSKGGGVGMRKVVGCTTKRLI